MKEYKVKVHKSLSKNKNRNRFGSKFTYKGFNIYENRKEKKI